MKAKSLLLVGVTLFLLTVMTQSWELWNQYQLDGNYIVPYQFDSSYKSRDHLAVVAAMETIAANTCIEFKPRTNEEDYVKFINGVDVNCHNDYFGRVAGENVIFYESSEFYTCDRKEIMVSLLMSLGLFWEEDRVDRDKYIKVHPENLADSTRNSIFEIQESTKNYISVPYDYLSITHSAKDAYAKAGTITYETLDPAFQDLIGKATEPTARDYEKINVLYGCK